jgi:uncharacterized Zn finger protein
MRTPHDDAGLVAPADRCPVCREDRSDELIWIDDDLVQCATCGTTYRPGEAKGGEDHVRTP